MPISESFCPTIDGANFILYCPYTEFTTLLFLAVPLLPVRILFESSITHTAVQSWQLPVKATILKSWLNVNCLASLAHLKGAICIKRLLLLWLLNQSYCTWQASFFLKGWRHVWSSNPTSRRHCSSTLNKVFTVYYTEELILWVLLIFSKSKWALFLTSKDMCRGKSYKGEFYLAWVHNKAIYPTPLLSSLKHLRLLRNINIYTSFCFPLKARFYSTSMPMFQIN